MLANSKFLIILAGLILLQTGLMLIPGELRINGHEADLLHVVDVISRLGEGDHASIDFMTPLGFAAFAPFASLLALGFSPAQAILIGSALMAFLMLPGVLHVAGSRLLGSTKWVFGIGIVVLMTSVVYGGDQATVSISMYYNRWAWAVLFLILAVLFLPAQTETPRRDGALVGLGFGLLVTLKLTYAVALAPVLLIAVLQRREGRFLVWTLVGAVGWIMVVTLLAGGPGYWLGYLGDLLYVATSSMRTKPGLSLSDVAASPAYLPATALLLLSVVFWRRMGLLREGFLLLVMVPGFIYITFQNWGNDPKWVFILGILLIALRHRTAGRTWLGADGLQASNLMAVAAFVLIAPSMLNMSYSTVRHLALASERFAPIYEDADIVFEISRNFDGAASVGLPAVPFASARPEGADPGFPITALKGEDLRFCQLTTGLLGVTQSMRDELAARDLADGHRVLVADIYDFLWLTGPFQRNKGMAPWYYGAPSGFNGTEILIVPLCPISDNARRSKITNITDRGWSLTEIFRTDHFIALSVGT